MNGKCPRLDSLRNYIRGQSLDTDSQVIESHIAICRECQSQLEVISEESDAEMSLIKQTVAAHSQKTIHSTIVQGQQPIPNFQYDLSSKAYACPNTWEQFSMDMIRDYRIMEQIGQGGMGTVYRALDVPLNRLVAIKILKSDRMESSEAKSRFEREMQLLAKLEHPHIVRVHSGGKHEGLPYFVMEYVTGVDLGQILRRLGPLPAPDVCSIARIAAAALRYAHAQKIIHRDIKPTNLMITSEGNVKLLDLGLAQILDLNINDAISTADQAVGTLPYMAPEQLCGVAHVTAQSDIYSLGVTIYEMLTGLRPYDRPGMPLLIEDIRMVRPDVEPALCELVRDMISINPPDRPVSMEAVEARLCVIAVQADLSSLICEYYRWSSRPGAGGMSRTTTPAPLLSPPIQVRQPSNVVSHSSPASLTDRLKTTHPWQWILGTSLAVLAVPLIAWGFFLANPGQEKQGSAPEEISKLEVPAPVIPAPTTGTVDVVPQSEFAKETLDKGLVSIENTASGLDTPLTSGENQLEPGEYRLYYDAPVDLEEEGRVFDVMRGSTTRLPLRALLTKSFQDPDIPLDDAFASYYVRINDIHYELRLEAISRPNLQSHGSSSEKWLIVSNSHSLENGNFTETASLKIDDLAWQKDQQLEILEGWIEVDSPGVREYLANHSSNHKGINAGSSF